MADLLHVAGHLMTTRIIMIFVSTAAIIGYIGSLGSIYILVGTGVIYKAVYDVSKLVKS